MKDTELFPREEEPKEELDNCEDCGTCEKPEEVTPPEENKPEEAAPESDEPKEESSDCESNCNCD